MVQNITSSMKHVISFSAQSTYLYKWIHNLTSERDWGWVGGSKVVLVRGIDLESEKVLMTVWFMVQCF
jgi:hypothetical protein